MRFLYLLIGVFSIILIGCGSNERFVMLTNHYAPLDVTLMINDSVLLSDSLDELMIAPGISSSLIVSEVCDDNEGLRISVIISENGEEYRKDSVLDCDFTYLYLTIEKKHKEGSIPQIIDGKLCWDYYPKINLYTRNREIVLTM